MKKTNKSEDAPVKKPSTVDRIEIFAQAIVSGKTQADAYRDAYPTTATWKADSVHQKASVMAADVKVRSRIDQIRKEVAEKILWSREESALTLKKIAIDESYKGSERISAVKELNAMFGYNSPVKIDHTSTDGTMSPVGLDVSKLSEQTMKELLNARGQK